MSFHRSAMAVLCSSSRVLSSLAAFQPSGGLWTTVCPGRCVIRDELCLEGLTGIFPLSLACLQLILIWRCCWRCLSLWSSKDSRTLIYIKTWLKLLYFTTRKGTVHTCKSIHCKRTFILACRFLQFLTFCTVQIQERYISIDMSLKNEVTFSSVLFYAHFGISDLKKLWIS